MNSSDQITQWACNLVQVQNIDKYLIVSIKIKKKKNILKLF